MLRILHLENNSLDADLAKARLTRAGLECEVRQVITRDEFVRAMDECAFDLILADYILPTFSGPAALEIARVKQPEVPFIFVSGVLGEEIAIDSLKIGATDYVLKQRIDRLVPAVRRALAEARERKRRQAVEAILREKEQHLQAALDAAQSASRAKDHFLAILSHELRTPLAPILTTVQLLEMEPLSDEARHGVEVIRRNAELEARLIDDLLDLTRIARDKLQMHLQNTNLHTLIDSVMDICGSDMRGKRHDVTLDLAAANSTVNGDSARLQQILWNLVKNAVKFTPLGGRITVRSRNTPDDCIEVEVQDSGIGIDAEALPRIFSAFEQADQNVTRQFGGLGLGLAIARALAEKQHGSLTALSDGPGAGATFRLRLPTVCTPKQSEVLPAKRKITRALKILLVEDHQDTARAMSRLLNRLGHDVKVAGSVQDALAFSAVQQFDLLISDIGLPDGSGLDVVRQWQGGSSVPSIALTGFGMDHDVEQCRQAGFSEHLTKPVNFDTLEAVIRGLAGSVVEDTGQQVGSQLS